MADLAKLTAANAARWKAAKVRPSVTAMFQSVAARLLDGKPRFQAVSDATGVPWFVIAVIKEREAGVDRQWLRSIAQGDPWNATSTHVPSGRGPFPSWHDAAVDALVHCAPYAARWRDWSAGGTLTLLEQYNGLGYANGPFEEKTGTRYPPQPSPYIWSGTDQYVSGKYTRDRYYEHDFVDQQLGCAPLLMALREIDPSIRFADEFETAPSPPDVPKPVPAPPAPAKSWLALLIEAILSLFTK